MDKYPHFHIDIENKQITIDNVLMLQNTFSFNGQRFEKVSDDKILVTYVSDTKDVCYNLQWGFNYIWYVLHKYKDTIYTYSNKW